MPKLGAISSTSPDPAPGRIAPWWCARSRDGESDPGVLCRPSMGENGWSTPKAGFASCTSSMPRQSPDYTGRVTVPVLWDRRAQRIVNNESSEIIRMLNREFDPFAARRLDDLYPCAFQKEIDRINERVYRTVNNGVYRAGFATAQDKYDAAVTGLFGTLDWLEKRLAEAALAVRHEAHRSGRAALHDAGALRRRLLLPFQVQSAAAGGLSETMALHAKVLCAAAWRARSISPRSNPTTNRAA